MQRRQFVKSLAMASAASATGFQYSTQTGRATSTIDPLAFDSSASLVDHRGDPLEDESVVAVWAESTASNKDVDGNGDATIYDDETPIPLVAVDGNVVGLGNQLVTDATDWQYGNEQFLLNVFDETLGGSGTIYWDEGHDQYYTRSKCSTFEGYAERNGYTIESTESLTSDLASADAAIVTSPSKAFSSGERAALGNFLDGGGWLFAFSQSDYQGYDETANLNELLSALGVAFRFNDDQVLDATNNAGKRYQPTTTRFNQSVSYFGDRSGLELERGQTYQVRVESATDGDTVDVTFADGRTESIRILGLDTPEKAANAQHERIQEWEGIEETSVLQTKARAATQFAREELLGKTVDLSFDEHSAVRDDFGRVLGYIHYDADGDGSRDAFYNGRIVENGLARVYDGSTGRHDALWAREREAKQNGRGVWAESDPASSSVVRNRAVEELFFPRASSVRTARGAIADSRVPVRAETTARQRKNTGVDYEDVPLVGVDEETNTALVGAPIIDEHYEKSEGFAVDTATYENFVFLSNLIDYLGTRSGETVFIDGGHGQFGAEFGLTAEDAAYYLRYLEGHDVRFEGINDVTGAPETLTGAQAFIVATPPEQFTDAETKRVRDFVANGGTLVLLGDARAPPAARKYLNDLAAAVGSDLRVNGDAVVDPTNNVEQAAIPTTTRFDESLPLFEAYEPGRTGDDSDENDGGTDDEGSLVIEDVNANAMGPDYWNPSGEYVVFRNAGDAPLDLTGYTVTDSDGHTYQFTSGFTLAADATVTLRSGRGINTGSTLYWGSGPIWNNHGDTVRVLDETGETVASKRY